MLCLAGRYDGIDLPGDDCRLLIMAESPGAVGALERHLREHWKLGPLLRRRERTRLIQGMGRCTRDATDFAVIIRSTAEGAPDIVWIFHQRCYTFEAKAGNRLSKKYVLQSKGHVDWIMTQRREIEEAFIQPLVVSTGNDLDDTAKSHVRGQLFLGRRS